MKEEGSSRICAPTFHICCLIAINLRRMKLLRFTGDEHELQLSESFDEQNQKRMQAGEKREYWENILRSYRVARGCIHSKKETVLFTIFAWNFPLWKSEFSLATERTVNKHITTRWANTLSALKQHWDCVIEIEFFFSLPSVDWWTRLPSFVYRGNYLIKYSFYRR